MPINANPIVVIGSGMAGLSTALGLAECGLNAAIVEEKERIGGHAAEWTCMATDNCAKCGACMAEDLRQKVLRHDNIQIFTNSKVTGIEGEAGNFKVTIEGKATQTLESPAVVVATGFTPFDAKQDPMYGYGMFPGVFTIKDVDEILRRDELTELVPADMEQPRIAFIQCVGSRNRTTGRDYCSQFCCKNSVRLTKRIKHLLPNATISVFYIDLQVMGKQFRSFYKEGAKVVDFVQGVPAEIVPETEAGPYRLHIVNPEDGQTKGKDFDRVVLAIGIDRNPGNEGLAKLLGLELDSRGFFVEESNKASREGIYLAGASAGPTTIPSAMAHGLAAAAQIRADLLSEKADVTKKAEPRILHQF